MAESGKKIEVRYGAFACRVEGFDDPVEPLREVLSLMQRMIAETPGLADQHPALDEAQFARIGEALADRSADAGAIPGLIFIRSGEGDGGMDADFPSDPAREDNAGDIAVRSPAGAQPAADADPDAWPPHRPAADLQPADPGPHPSAAVYAAPAAAAAEAAFAASVAGAAPRDEADAQGPLGAEEPGERATPAALFSAPAADVAGGSFPERFAAAARPADPDDDAGDPDLAWADEAAEERVHPAAPEPAAEPAADPAADPAAEPAAEPDFPVGAASAGATHGREEAPGAEPSAARPHAPDSEGTEHEPTGPERTGPGGTGPEGTQPGWAEHARTLGGPGEGWSPWQSGPGGARSMGATSMEAPPRPSAFGGENWPDPAPGEPAGAPALRAPSPGHDEAGDEALPAINIFAPPPPDAPPAASPDAPPHAPSDTPPGAPAADRAAPEPAAAVFETPPEPLAPLRRRPPAAADDAEIVPDIPASEVPARRRTPLRDDAADEGADRDADEALDDGAGDWPGGDEEQDAAQLDAEPSGSAENRLAALIMRYQGGLHGPAAREPEPAPAGVSLSAAELAERAEATEVEDLLAVSAAWLALCGGRGRFTRREVMEVFETLPGDHPRTLEARIKGFGSLVRSGTVLLVDDGEFSLAPGERARFRALIDQG